MSEWGAYAGPGGSDERYPYKPCATCTRNGLICPLEHQDWYWGSPVKCACIIGMGSDIGSHIAKRLRAIGWDIWGTTRKDVDLAEFVDAKPKGKHWSLLIFAAGTMEPIDKFFFTDPDEWERAIRINALGPLRVLRSLWYVGDEDNCKVVFISGPNPTVPTPSYTAYQAGKALLKSIIPTLNAECGETVFYWFEPGVVKTKIHEQTINAGPIKAANFERAKAILSGVEESKSLDDVYFSLMKLIGENPFPENEGT